MKILYLIYALFFTCIGSFVYSQNKDSASNEFFSVHFQSTLVNQYKPAFSAAYTGAHSLKATSENALSSTTTFYLGAKLWKGAKFFINPEVAGGEGLSQVYGIGAATNGETFRIGDPKPTLYLARLFFSQRFALTKETILQEDDFNQFKEKIPKKYIAITAGKVGLADYFDDNTYSHDPRTQFLSWALMDAGSWDYAANTRGYTPSFITEFVTPKHELRAGISLLPKEANGMEMNWDISKSYALNFEWTYRYTIAGLPGAVRILYFFNNTNMGNYKESMALDSIPDITKTRKYGRKKNGVIFNLEQKLNDFVGCFIRASWDDGANETWCFTEIDQSISGGFSINGKNWDRAKDEFGIAYLINGLAKPHIDYLKRGGIEFMLGDGKLNYKPEQLGEFYYKANVYQEKVFLSVAYQIITNPGYNADRPGPVHVFSFRIRTRF